MYKRQGVWAAFRVDEGVGGWRVVGPILAVHAHHPQRRVAPWPLHAFLCKGYLYSLHHILSGPSIFSRIFSNIENILTRVYRRRPKVAPKPAQNLQNLKISVGIDPKPTVEGGIAVSSSLVKTVLDAAQRQRQEYSRISLDSRSTKVKGCGKLVYS